jgi:hypothetical protein
VHVVDLITSGRAAVFGAVWRGIEAKLVECQALTDSIPEFKSTYDAAGSGLVMTASRAPP